MNIRKSAIDLSPELYREELGSIRLLIDKNRMRGSHLEIGTATGGTLRELLLCCESP